MSALSDLSSQIVKCVQCPALVRNRTRVVPGEGAESAEVMFIGEGPGWHEDQQGRPFVGPAGAFLNELISSVGWSREQVFIANVIKCRPPQNRDPLPDEITACRHWLDSQLAIIKPKLIITLGRYSMAMAFPGKSISKVHGTAVKKDGVTYFAMYHPAAALHQQKLRQTILEDMLKAPALLTDDTPPAAAAAAEAEPPAKQLNMFEV